MQIENFFPYRLAVVAEAFSRQLIAVYGRKYGFSREEWRMLFLLADAGSLNSLQLAQRSSLDKVQVSRAASRLEKKAMITRDVTEADRRLRNYEITAKGLELFQRAFHEVEARSREILEAMPTNDRAALEQGIAVLDQAISEVNPATADQDSTIPRPARSGKGEG